MTKKGAHSYDDAMSRWDEAFAKIESRFVSQIFLERTPKSKKISSKEWRQTKAIRSSELTGKKRQAYEKEQAKYAKEDKREERWNSIRGSLQQIINNKSYDPNSELFRTTKELIDTVDKAQEDPLSVSRYEIRKFRTGCHRLNALIKAELKEQQGHPHRASETEQKTERSVPMLLVRSNKDIWEAIKGEYDITKMTFGKKINFVSDSFKRKIIFRDVEHAFVLASEGFSKPALILAGGVIEELLRLYLSHKKIKPKNERFADYIKACEDNNLLKRGVSRLTDSIRDFRNLVHLDNEKTKQHTVSKATAKGAVSSIFTIANDFR